MKRSNRNLRRKTIAHVAGWLIAAVSLYFAVRNINLEQLKHALNSMRTVWIYPIVIGNFVVIALKAIRWQITLKPVKAINFATMFKVLTVGFMANCILPARLGDVLRIHLLGRDASISRVTTTTTVVADRLLEGVAFLFIAALLVIFTDVPGWMERGLIATLLITLVAYLFAIIYSTREFESSVMRRLQAGIESLRRPGLTIPALGISILSWALQGFLIYMAQMAFGVDIPVWGIVLVLVAVNLAIFLPSAPGNLGTFELACVLAYMYLGLDKGLGLLIGITYHILQVIPVILAGGAVVLSDYFGSRKTPVPAAGHDTPY